MAIYYCGFNGFQQIINQDKIISRLTEVDLKCIDDLKEIYDIDMYIHWSYSVFKINSNLYKIGYCMEQDKVVNKKLPLNEIKEVSNIFCNEDKLFLLDTNGSLFKYTDETNLFTIENLNHVVDNAIDEESYEARDSVKLTHISGGNDYTAFIAQNRNFHISSKKIFNFDEDIIGLSCGFKHALILTAQGNVYSWGHGSRGQLGHGELSNEECPRLIEALSGIKISAISAGGWHSCAIGSLGDLYTWGSNEKGQLGLPVAGCTSNVNDCDTIQINTDTGTYNILALPKLINFINETFEVLQVSCGNAHTVIYGNDMSLYGAGWNKYKQIGIDTDNGDIVQGFCKIKSDLNFGQNLILKCGPWSTSVILK